MTALELKSRKAHENIALLTNNNSYRATDYILGDGANYLAPAVWDGVQRLAISHIYYTMTQYRTEAENCIR